MFSHWYKSTCVSVLVGNYPSSTYKSVAKFHFAVTSTDSPSSQSESDNTPAIVGGVVAGAVFLITIAVTIVVLVLRKCTQIQKRYNYYQRVSKLSM